MPEFQIKTSKRNELIDITAKVQSFVSGSSFKEGLCLVFVSHTTAGVTINENSDPAVLDDLLKKLSSMVPENEGYKHSEGNSDAHVKSTLVGCSATIPFSGKKLLLGPWQGIFFCEFDGPRSRKFCISLVKSD